MIQSKDTVDFSSFGEIYHRCELILFIGFKKSLPDEFKHLKKGLKKPKIIFLMENLKLMTGKYV